MSGGDEANKEFQEQLRMQELYAQRNANESDPCTYTDPEDGTVYAWDHEKKAWFPKVSTFVSFFQCVVVGSAGKIQSLRLKSTHIAMFFGILGRPKSYLYHLCLLLW